MSDHRLDTFEHDLAGAPRCSLEHAQKARKHYGRHAREPSAADEHGALAVVDLLGCGDSSHAACGGRMAFFRVPGAEQCGIIFLDRAEQPGAHAPGEDHPRVEPREQSVAPRHSQPGDAGPLFGTPGCAAPDDCGGSPGDPARSAEIPRDPTAPALLLVCSKCGKRPPPDLIAIEGGTHYLVRQRNDWSRPKVDFKRLQGCGKWKPVAP